MTTQTEYDVIVVGAGNAAMCAALSATEQGARVLVLEKASEADRGGNSAFTAGGFRFVHAGIEDLRSDVLVDLSPEEVEKIVIPPISEERFLEDLMKVTDGLSNEAMAELLISRSRETIGWMRTHGVRFIPMYGRQSFFVDGKHHFYGGVNIEAVGGGWGLVDSLFKQAAKLGVDVRYETGLRSLLQDQTGAISGVRAKGPNGFEEFKAKAVVLACGGFEANPEMRTRYLGPGWELCRVRGTRHNTGDGIRAALDIGAEAYGGWSGAHAVQWDISAPPFGDRTILDNFQKHSYPIGIVVNLNGERFIDEGADYRNHTYAKYGREVMKQPQRAAVQIFDAKTIDMVRDEYRIRQVTKVEADTIEELAEGLGIDAGKLEKTITEFNAACQPGDYNPSILDGKGTAGITPPKSNWALPIDKAPYTGFIVTCGITFTFGGLHINTDGEVQDTTDHSIPGLYAAGELVGGLFYNNYPGGTGLMSGAVFGRLSGKTAGEYAKRLKCDRAEAA
jgi:tricarballylate dehydrogenase